MDWARMNAVHRRNPTPTNGAIDISGTRRLAPVRRRNTKAAAWKDTLGTSGSCGRANITGVATGSRNRLPTEARTGPRPSWNQAQPASVLVFAPWRGAIKVRRCLSVSGPHRTQAVDRRRPPTTNGPLDFLEVIALSRRPGWVRIPHGLQFQRPASSKVRAPACLAGGCRFESDVGRQFRGAGRVVRLQPSKLITRVRFSRAAPDGHYSGAGSAT